MCSKVYDKIPGFGGFLIKADSEAGPLLMAVLTQMVPICWQGL